MYLNHSNNVFCTAIATKYLPYGDQYEDYYHCKENTLLQVGKEGFQKFFIYRFPGCAILSFWVVYSSTSSNNSNIIIALHLSWNNTCSEKQLSRSRKCLERCQGCQGYKTDLKKIYDHFWRLLSWVQPHNVDFNFLRLHEKMQYSATF